MIDVEAALFDLAEHLDHPNGTDLDAAVRARIAAPLPAPFERRQRRRSRVVVAVAAAFVVIAAAIATIPPARHAVADWLGIGAVEIRRSSRPLPPANGAHPVPGARGKKAPAPDPPAAQDLAAARRAVGFPISTPSGAAPVLGVVVDRRVRDGLVEMRYPRFTLVEIASAPGSGPVVGKLLEPTAHADYVTVDSSPGVWIIGTHDVAYLGRDGTMRSDTVRRSGPVLVWVRAGVTYRVEGLPRLADALAIALSVH